MDHSPRHAAAAASSKFASVIRVTRPAAGESQYIASAAGARIYLDFDRQEADFERDGTHLRIKFDDGGSVTLANFFAVGDHPLPTFHSAEGEPIPASEFLSAYVPDFDYSPAPAGSGTLYEAAKAGELAKGLDRLDRLGTDYWSPSAEAESTRYSTLPADETRPLGGTVSTLAGPVGPLGPVGPVVSPTLLPLHIMAQSRAVAYLGSEGDNPGAGEYPHTLRDAFARALAGPGLTYSHYGMTADPVLEACSAGDGDFFTAVWEGGDAAFHITLTEAGSQWLKNNAGQDLVGYFRIEAPNHPNESYVLQTVFTSSDTFNSTITPLNEYYDASTSEFGETHHGVNPNKETGYNVTASGKMDELHFTGPVVDAGLDAGGGDDQLSITGVVVNSDIDMGSGRDDADIKGQLIVNSGAHTVTMDEGCLWVSAEDTATGTAVSVEGAELNIDGNAACINFYTSSTNGVSAGVNATAGGEMRVAGAGVTISADTYAGDGNSAGVVVNDNSDGVISASECLSVHARNQGTGSAYAAQSAGGSGLAMSGVGVELEAHSDASGAGAAVAMGAGSRLAVTSSEYLRMEAHGDGTTYGALASGGASVRMDADGSDGAQLCTSVISDSGTGYGLCSSGAGSELTATSTGTIDVSVTGTRAYALGSFSGTAEVTAARHLELNAVSTKGAYGIYATGSLVTVDTDYLSVSAGNTDGGAGNRAVYAGSGSEILIDTNSLNITSRANGGFQTEAVSAFGSRVEMSLKDSDDGAQATITSSNFNTPPPVPGSPYLITTGLGTQNGSIVLRGAQESVNTIDITSQADGGDLFGIRSYQAAQPVPTSVDILGGDLADSISITATGTGNTRAYGTYSARYTNIPNDATLTIDGGAGADTITIRVTSENREARACTASTSGDITIAGGEGSSISIYAESTANQAWGLSGQGGISLTGSRIDIQAHAHGNYMGAYAVQAWDPDQDVLIKGHESGLHLTVSASGASGSRAVYAGNQSAVIIEGSDTAADTITINGDVFSHTNSAGYGNQILTGGGNDSVDITGFITQTHISLGAGDDTLTLRPSPSTTDPDWVVTYSLFEGGTGFDVLNLDAFPPGGAFTLRNLTGYVMPGDTGGAISGFERIDLAGDNANILNLNLADLIDWNKGLDSLLEGLTASDPSLAEELSAKKYLVVTGTGDDTVTLEAGITDTGSEVTVGADTYRVCSSEDGLETHYLLILQSVTVA